MYLHVGRYLRENKVPGTWYQAMGKLVVSAIISSWRHGRHVVSIAAVKQKSKLTHCFVINALSQRYLLQASDQKDLQGWVDALNAASKITVPRPGSTQAPEIGSTGSESQEKKTQTAYKTEIIAGVVVQTPISQNGCECPEVIQHEVAPHPTLRRSLSLMPQFVHKPPSSICVLKSGYCVKQGNMTVIALDSTVSDRLLHPKCEKELSEILPPNRGQAV
ncbi:pleckstrin homology domain-containing family A member 2-like [Leptodactylus fuscus]|uniref:pleckstrin homology domain-containing family A member 2-like n=1 Tax=Leptodactylus fuscus TaxID=238119 RepID=UPI003F4EA9CB